MRSELFTFIGKNVYLITQVERPRAQRDELVDRYSILRLGCVSDSDGSSPMSISSLRQHLQRVCCFQLPGWGDRLYLSRARLLPYLLEASLAELCVGSLVYANDRSAFYCVWMNCSGDCVFCAMLESVAGF
ncbi:MAG: hypothetical protein NZM04_00580 [Methylacidiphilales bacterium]|nr:hypothetical protein [Candidatus Methylacidiphilales bacterium]